VVGGTGVIRAGGVGAPGPGVRVPSDARVIDANDPNRRPVSDFKLGQPGEGDVK
jgi:hypothetical protein